MELAALFFVLVNVILLAVEFKSVHGMATGWVLSLDWTTGLLQTATKCLIQRRTKLNVINHSVTLL